MKEFLKKYSDELYWTILIIVITVELGLIEFYSGWLGLGISVTDKSEDIKVIIYRNRGLALAAIIGIGLAIWGRSQTNKQIELSREANISERSEKTAQFNLNREANASERSEKTAQFNLNRAANANERYEKAAHMVGNQVLAVRIAGCHALESLGKDDEKMGRQCIQVLSAFIRNPFVEDKSEVKNETENRPIKQDTQAAVNGLSAINIHYCEKDKDWLLDKIDLTGASLREAHLVRADLIGADLKNVNLINAHLRGAKLIGADLSDAHLRGVDLTIADLAIADLIEANFTKANLNSADLSRADLSRADLNEANLTKANLTKANLTKANLTKANLTKANLTKADLSSAKNLTKSQIISAKFSFGTPPRLPEELEENEEIQKWIEDNISEHERLQENEDL